MPFQKGNTIGNRKGKPKGCRDFALEFLAALKKVEKSERVNYLEVALRKSLHKTDLMKSILNKMLPDVSMFAFGGGNNDVAMFSAEERLALQQLAQGAVNFLMQQQQRQPIPIPSKTLQDAPELKKEGEVDETPH